MPSSLTRQKIADIWEALRITLFVIITMGSIGAVLGLVFGFALSARISVAWCIGGVLVLWVLSSQFILSVWQTYSNGTVIDTQAGKLFFPAADVENSFTDIITFKSFFNLGRIEDLDLIAIRDVTNETRRATAIQRAHQERFAVNIMGNFGSRQLTFNSKQKRDEFRSALTHAMSKTGHAYGADINIDFPSS